MTSPKLFVILAIMALGLTLPSVALAQQVPPHLSLINATIDGEPAPDGTVITAMMDGKDDVTTTVANALAVIVIEGMAGDTGDTITFKIGDFDAVETDTWEQGGHSDAVLALSASSVPVEAGRMVTITLSELNDSGQLGTATLTEFGDNTQVALSLSAGALQSELVHIHLGKCGDDIGGVDLAPTSFVGGSGDSTTMAAASLDIFLDGDHAINAHESGNPGNYTACGNIPTGITATVETAWAGLSQYLVDGSGMSLYLFTVDIQGTGDTAPVTNCTVDACTAVWRPLWTVGEPIALEQPEFGVATNADQLGTLEWENGNVQVTYNGWPLYYFVKDLKPGDAYGQYGDWFLVAPQGTLLVGGTNVDPAGSGPGPAGDTGPSGPAGTKGDKGDQGGPGSAGPEGAAGGAGSVGLKGSPGSDGGSGPAGPAGATGTAGEKDDSGSRALGTVALILAIIALVGVGGVFLLRRGI